MKVSRLASLALLVAAGGTIAFSEGETSKDVFTPFQRNHWAFQPLRQVEPPQVRDSHWVSNPIDAFILARLESQNLKPSPQADKITLLRRATFDLLGLPPTPEEVEAFLSDESPHAFAKVIDRLLASPHYGERWGRHWLDLARYAESEGFKSDETRPNAWRYRDYVIESFNKDKPYDRFIREQIAGDELWPDDPEAFLATAFNRHYPDESNARNLMQRRQEILNDVTDTVASVFMGLTYACARCHDHKFDPILHTDYYRLQAFFANASAADDTLLWPLPLVARHRQQLALWEEKTRELREEIEALEAPKRQEIIDEFVVKYPEEIQSAIAKPAEQRTPFEWQMYYKAKAYLDPNSHAYLAPSHKVGNSLKGEAKQRWKDLQARLERFSYLQPGDLPVGTGMRDLSREAPRTHLLYGGAYDSPVEEVDPAFPAILGSAPPSIVPPPGLESTGRRMALANWLADAANPLTVRVIVNRIWGYHFGQPLVGTPSNFGLSGNRPTHPELLDWLAGELVRLGWSMKALHRAIMLSQTYRQMSGYREDAARVNPENKLYWRFPRRRLEAEVIRDSALFVSGTLNTKRGGPSVFPELPPGMTTRGGWDLTDDPQERNRRSIYVFVRRNTRYPMFETFDMPDTHESCPRREVTTSPLQALTLLNSNLALEWAQGFAGRVLRRAGGDPAAQVRAAFRLAYSRLPDNWELEATLDFLKRQRGIVSERARLGEKLALPSWLPEGMNPPEGVALVDFCHMLINSNEFVYLN